MGTTVWPSSSGPSPDNPRKWMTLGESTRNVPWEATCFAKEMNQDRDLVHECLLAYQRAKETTLYLEKYAYLETPDRVRYVPVSTQRQRKRRPKSPSRRGSPSMSSTVSESRSRRSSTSSSTTSTRSSGSNTSTTSSGALDMASTRTNSQTGTEYVFDFPPECV